VTIVERPAARTSSSALRSWSALGRLLSLRSSGPNIARRTVWLALAYLLLTGGLLAALLLQLRQEAVTASKKELGAFAQLAAGHTSDVLLGIEDSLKLTEVTLSLAAGTEAAGAESINAMLRDVVSGTKSLQNIFVLDAGGRIVYAAREPGDLDIGRSNQPYFTRFQNDSRLKFEVGAPLRRSAHAER